MEALIERACEILGSQRALADSLRVTPSMISQWKTGVRPVPIDRCVAIELATGGLVTRQDLRPRDWHRIWPELRQADGEPHAR